MTQPETYQFRRRRDLFASSGSTSSSNSTPSTANKSIDVQPSYLSPPRRSRNAIVVEEKAAGMKSPESYHFQRLYMAEGPKKKKNLTFAEPWKSPPESFAMKRGYRPEYTSSHRNSEMKTKSEQPESYQFRRVYRYHMTEQSTDTKKQQQQQPEELDEIKKMDSLRDMYQPLPIESYRFTRLLIPREKITISKETVEEQAMRRANETTIRWDEIEDARYYVPPESYRMNTSYLRAEPKGTYKDAYPQATRDGNAGSMLTDYRHDHQRIRSAPSSSSSSSTPQPHHRPRTTCSCLFFAYHGYCHGNHEAETRKYYNIDPESATGDTIAWREYPNHSAYPNHTNSTQAVYHSSNKGGNNRDTTSSSSSGVINRDKVMYTKVTTSSRQLAEATIGPMLLSIEPRVVGAEAEAAKGRGGSSGLGMTSKNNRSPSTGRLSHRRGNRLDDRLRERYRQACGYGGNKAGGGMAIRTESVAPKTAWDDDYSVCVRGNYGGEDRGETLLHVEEDKDGLVYDDYDDDDY